MKDPKKGYIPLQTAGARLGLSDATLSAWINSHSKEIPSYIAGAGKSKTRYVHWESLLKSRARRKKLLEKSNDKKPNFSVYTKDEIELMGIGKICPHCNKGVYFNDDGTFVTHCPHWDGKDFRNNEKIKELM